MLQQSTEFDRLLATYAKAVFRREIHAACEFAADAHAGQTRRSGEPYITHPLAVASLVMSWRMDANSVITALLHDVLEDTDVTPATLENNFGKSVCTMVQALTKPQRDSGGVTGIHAPSQALAPLLAAGTRDPRVLRIKLADRLHNTRTLQHLDPTRRRRIARETLIFYVPLARRIGMHAIAHELQLRAESSANLTPAIAAQAAHFPSAPAC